MSLALLVRFIPAWKNETLLFFVSGVALIPLAAWLGQATECLSAHAGPGVGLTIPTIFTPPLSVSPMIGLPPRPKAFLWRLLLSFLSLTFFGLFSL
jgi:hypothetical protein